MAVITLHTYFNGKSLTLNSDDIDRLKRYTKKDDAAWGHLDPKPYTAVYLKKGKISSEGVQNAYVSETPQQIRSLSAA